MIHNVLMQKSIYLRQNVKLTRQKALLMSIDCIKLQLHNNKYSSRSKLLAQRRLRLEHQCQVCVLILKWIYLVDHQPPLHHHTLTYRHVVPLVRKNDPDQMRNLHKVYPKVGRKGRKKIQRNEKIQRKRRKRRNQSRKVVCPLQIVVARQAGIPFLIEKYIIYGGDQVYSIIYICITIYLRELTKERSKY